MCKNRPILYNPPRKTLSSRRLLFFLRWFTLWIQKRRGDYVLSRRSPLHFQKCTITYENLDDAKTTSATSAATVWGYFHIIYMISCRTVSDSILRYRQGIERCRAVQCGVWTRQLRRCGSRCPTFSLSLSLSVCLSLCVTWWCLRTTRRLSQVLLPPRETFYQIHSNSLIHRHCAVTESPQDISLFSLDRLLNTPDPLEVDDTPYKSTLSLIAVTYRSRCRTWCTVMCKVSHRDRLEIRMTILLCVNITSVRLASVT